jgi:hypothetical protein
MVPRLPDRGAWCASMLVNPRCHRPFEPGDHRPEGLGVALRPSLLPSRMIIPVLIGSGARDCARAPSHTTGRTVFRIRRLSH